MSLPKWDGWIRFESDCIVNGIEVKAGTSWGPFEKSRNVSLEPIPPTQGDMMRGKTAEEDARARYPDVVAQSDIDRLVELANAWKQRAEAAEARVKVADEMVKLFLTEAEHCPMLPIGIDPLQREQWTDWITTVLKNCGAHQVSARSKGEPA